MKFSRLQSIRLSIMMAATLGVVGAAATPITTGAKAETAAAGSQIGVGGAAPAGSRVVDYSVDRWLHVFSRGINGELWHDFWTGAGWGNQLLDIRIASDPVAIEYDRDRSLHVFARGTDGLLRHAWSWNGTTWYYEPFSNVAVVDTPAVAVLGDGLGQTLHVFAHGLGNRLHHSWWDHTRWNHESLYEDGLAGNPAVTRYQGELHVFARWYPAGLAHIWWNGTRWDKQILNVSIGFDPVAIEYPRDGSLQVFYRGPDDDRRLRHLWWNGTRWDTDVLYGIDILGRPAATTYVDGTLHVFAHTMGNGLEHAWWPWNGNQWNMEFLDDGLQTGGRPAAAAYRDGSLQVFASSLDNKLRHSYYLNGWHHETLDRPIFT